MDELPCATRFHVPWCLVSSRAAALFWILGIMIAAVIYIYPAIPTDVISLKSHVLSSWYVLQKRNFTLNKRGCATEILNKRGCYFGVCTSMMMKRIVALFVGW